MGKIMASKSNKRSTHREDKTQPAEERGEGLGTARTIARGGKNTGVVAGATESRGTGAPAEVVMPPAPPGESRAEGVRKTQAVADALIELGEHADPKQVAMEIKGKSGLTIEPGEVATI